jgi:hypothetical protein
MNYPSLHTTSTTHKCEMNKSIHRHRQKIIDFLVISRRNLTPENKSE